MTIAIHQFVSTTNLNSVVLTNICTQTHPDHEVLPPPIGGEPRFWTVWCSICEERGYNSNGQHNCANPEMSPEYLAEARAWVLTYPVKPTKRTKCPTCGKL